MKPGKEMDILVATQVMGHAISKQKQMVYEASHQGTRPLRSYSKNIEDAWEVVMAIGITMIPIDDGSWFAMVGPREGWKSPAEFIDCMQKGDFARSGAAVTQSAPLSICLAALNAVEKRKTDQNNFDTLSPDSLN
jgi:hypothetical protein